MTYINVYYDRDVLKYISYIYTTNEKYIYMEESDLFMCLSGIYKKLKLLSYSERININRNVIRVVMYDRKKKEYYETTENKFRNIFHIIF